MRARKQQLRQVGALPLLVNEDGGVEVVPRDRTGQRALDHSQGQPHSRPRAARGGRPGGPGRGWPGWRGRAPLHRNIRVQPPSPRPRDALPRGRLSTHGQASVAQMGRGKSAFGASVYPRDGFVAGGFLKPCIPDRAAFVLRTCNPGMPWQARTNPGFTPLHAY